MTFYEAFNDELGKLAGIRPGEEWKSISTLPGAKMAVKPERRPWLRAPSVQAKPPKLPAAPTAPPAK